MENLCDLIFLDMLIFSDYSSCDVGWCVASDKSILQGIAKAVGSKVTPAWTSTGDPCSDYWHGIICDSAGYVIGISIDSVALLGTGFSSIYIFTAISMV